MKHRVMPHLVVAFMSSLFSLAVHAEACWDEGEYKAQKVSRGQCTENISVSKEDFPRAFCTPAVGGDANQKDAKCPGSAKLKDGAHPVAARCEGAYLNYVNGKVRVVYYGGGEFSGNRETLRDMCFMRNGKWQEGAV